MEAPLLHVARLDEGLLSILPGLLLRRRDDARWTVEDADPGAARRLGLDLHEVEQRGLLSLIDERDADRVFNEIVTTPPGARYTVRYRVRTGGREIPIEEHGRRLQDPIRGPMIEAFLLDASREEGLRRQLEKTEERTRILTQHGSVAFWQLDREGRFVAAIGQYAKDVVFIGRSVEEVFAGADERLIANNRRALAGESFRDQVSFDGFSFDCWYSPLFDDQGDISGAIGIAADVTERVRTEESLRQSEELNRRILEAMPGGLVLVSSTGEVLRANDFAEKFLGLSLPISIDEYGPRTVHEDGSPCPIEEYPVARCLATGEPQPPMVIGVRQPRGDLRWALFTALPVFTPGTRELSGAVVTFIDITDRKRAEEEKVRLELQLAQAQKLEALGRLAGGIAHDFNNILMAVLGHVGLLKLWTPPASDERRACETMELAAQRAAELTRQLLGFSRRGKYQHVSFELSRTIEEAVALLSRTIDKTIRIVNEPSVTPALVAGDPGQIQQVVLNLALNARDAMPSGGELRFKTKAVELGSEVTAHRPDARPGRYVILEVSDTGTGIAPEVLSHVFEPFFTTKAPGKGTGMGLAMVYGIVQNHGGFVEIESEVGRGTKVSVALPAAASHAFGEEPTTARPAVRGGAQARVLVVDDEPLVLRTLEAQLNLLGHFPVTALDGERAIELYRERTFDVVVLDVNMPRMSGLDCFEAIRSINPNAHVLISTGYGREDLMEKLRERGVCAILQKPYRAADLSEAIDRCLSGH